MPSILFTTRASLFLFVPMVLTDAFLAKRFFRMSWGTAFRESLLANVATLALTVVFTFLVSMMWWSDGLATALNIAVFAAWLAIKAWFLRRMGHASVKRSWSVSLASNAISFPSAIFLAALIAEKQHNTNNDLRLKAMQHELPPLTGTILPVGDAAP